MTNLTKRALIGATMTAAATVGLLAPAGAAPAFDRKDVVRTIHAGDCRAALNDRIRHFTVSGARITGTKSCDYWTDQYGRTWAIGVVYYYWPAGRG